MKDIEKNLKEMPSQLEDKILDKVGEMLTDNIYDIIPGYGEMEQKVHNFTTQFEDAQEELTTAQSNIQDLQDLAQNNKSDLDYLKQKFSAAFIQKIDKAMTTV